jgi:hypothetical protein
MLLLAGFIILAIVVLAAFLPVYFIVIRPHQQSSGTQATLQNPESPTGATMGGNGSTVTTADGQQFTYINNFGGYCKSIYFVFFYLLSLPRFTSLGRSLMVDGMYNV